MLLEIVGTHPTLSRPAADYIATVYAEMRQLEKAEVDMACTYTTPRTLLSILRLSQALAKLRFDTTVRHCIVFCDIIGDRPWPGPGGQGAGQGAVRLGGKGRAASILRLSQALAKLRFDSTVRTTRRPSSHTLPLHPKYIYICVCWQSSLAGPWPGGRWPGRSSAGKCGWGGRGRSAGCAQGPDRPARPSHPHPPPPPPPPPKVANADVDEPLRLTPWQSTTPHPTP